MRAKRPEHKSDLSLRQGFLGPGALRDAHHLLTASVFGTAPRPSLETKAPLWRTFALYDGNGRCVAGVEARLLSFEVDGRPRRLTGLRRVCVDEAWRGLGLLRTVIEPAIAWCDRISPDPCLLYAEHPALYERFGFAQRPQHAFVGPPPCEAANAPPRAQPIDARSREGTALLRRLLGTRTAVSSRCALVGAPDLVLHNLHADPDLAVVHARDLDAAIVHEKAGDDLVLVDVIAARMPSMAEIVAALGVRPGMITTLFTPDRLDWEGRPVANETGLMCRGDLPPALTQPFMLSPTSDF